MTEAMIPKPNVTPKLLPKFDISHAEINAAIGNTDALPLGKVHALAMLTFEHYRKINGASHESLPSDQEVKDLVVFASYLQRRAKDPEVSIDLEMLDEALVSVEELSPISIARYIERVESLRPIPKTNTLVIKLWTYDHMAEDPDMLPAHFETSRKTSLGIREAQTQKGIESGFFGGIIY